MLFSLIVITYLDRVCISLVGVRIKNEFHLTNSEFGWVLGAFAFAYALFEIPSGILGDRLGQRKVLIRIVLWWSLFTALTGLTSGLISLIAIRFLFGIGEAGAFPNSTGVIGRWFPASEVSRGISTLSIGINTGAAIAPLIVVPVAIAFGWRATFFVNALAGMVWAVVCYRWFRDEPAAMKGISMDELGQIEQSRCFLEHDKNFGWKKVFQYKKVWPMLFAFFCSQWGLYFFVAWMPVYLQQGRHFSEGAMKTTMFTLFATGIIGAIAAGFLSDRLIKRKGLQFGRRMVGLMALAMTGLFFFVAGLLNNGIAAALALIIAGFFLSFFAIAAFATCVDIGGKNAGTVAGVMNFFGQSGAFFIALFFGRIADITHSYNMPLFTIGGMLAAGGLRGCSSIPV